VSPVVTTRVVASFLQRRRGCRFNHASVLVRCISPVWQICRQALLSRFRVGSVYLRRSSRAACAAASTPPPFAFGISLLPASCLILSIWVALMIWFTLVVLPHLNSGGGRERKNSFRDTTGSPAGDTVGALPQRHRDDVVDSR
jgi:hypothetical protein